MSEPITILSGATVTHEEFLNFLKSLGAILTPESEFDARLSDVERHLWIAFDDEGLRSFEEDEELAQERETIERMLGAKPRTQVVVEISDTEGSERMAVDFACAFAKKWPSVVDDSRDKIYSMHELFDLRRNGRGFTDRYLLPSSESR